MGVGVWGGGPYKKMGIKKNSVKGVGGVVAGGGIGGDPYKKMGVQFFFLQLYRGPEGPPGGQRPPALRRS